MLVMLRAPGLAAAGRGLALAQGGLRRGYANARSGASKKGQKSTKASNSAPPNTSGPATPAPPPVGAADGGGGGGGGGLGKLLLFGALVAPPAYIAYQTKTNPEFRSAFKGQFPGLYSSIAPYLVDESVGSESSGSELVEGMETATLKSELDELEKRWDKAATHVTKFSKSEVSKMQKQIDQVKANMAKETAAKVAKHVEEEQPASPAPDQVAEETASAKAPIVAPAREKLEHVRSQARAVKARADASTDAEIKAIEKELRGDLETVLSHDLTHLDLEQLRSRVVQLVLELKDRNRWEALRMHELTKKHTEDLVAKYDAILQETRDKYEELVRYESASATAKAVEQANVQAEEHLARVISRKEQQFRTEAQAALERQREEMGREMEARFGKAKASVEERAAEDMKARLGQLQALKERVIEQQNALAARKKADKATHQVRSVSIALVDLQQTVRNDPASVGSAVAALEKAADGDETVLTVTRSLPDRVRKGGVAREIELVQRFSTVYDNCYRVSLVPEDGGVLEHAFAHVVAGLTIQGGSGTKQGADSQQAHLAKARELLIEKHDLGASVKEMSQLQGNVKQTASDWLVSAQDLLAVEQAIELIRSHMSSVTK